MKMEEIRAMRRYFGNNGKSLVTQYTGRKVLYKGRLVPILEAVESKRSATLHKVAWIEMDTLVARTVRSALGSTSSLEEVEDELPVIEFPLLLEKDGLESIAKKMAEIMRTWVRVQIHPTCVEKDDGIFALIAAGE